MGEAQAIDSQANIAGRNRNMPDIEPAAEYFPDKAGHAQHEAQADIADQRTRMLFHIIGQAAQSFGSHGQTQHRVGLQPAADLAVLYLVLHIAGDDAAKEEEHPRITGV